MAPQWRRQQQLDGSGHTHPTARLARLAGLATRWPLRLALRAFVRAVEELQHRPRRVPSVGAARPWAAAGRRARAGLAQRARECDPRRCQLLLPRARPPRAINRASAWLPRAHHCPAWPAERATAADGLSATGRQLLPDGVVAARARAAQLGGSSVVRCRSSRIASTGCSPRTTGWCHAVGGHGCSQRCARQAAKAPVLSLSLPNSCAGRRFTPRARSTPRGLRGSCAKLAAAAV